jgi:aryl sulfotransferase
VRRDATRPDGKYTLERWYPTFISPLIAFEEPSMQKLIRAPTRAVRSRIFDSARWAGYEPRPDDIIIATYSKCGTTWMQRIVSMLVFGSAAPQPIWDLSPWPDMRLFGPIEETLATARAQTHRRFFKTHLPLDALPVYEGVKFIHVARDGRDAALSLHNHLFNFTAVGAGLMEEVSRNDPKFVNAEMPIVPENPAEYWKESSDPNVLLVHYNDLKTDRAGEMHRIANFLDIDIAEALWPDLVAAAGFEAMKAQGDELIPRAQGLWEGGAGRFLHKGTNGRWQNLFAAEDLARYDAQVKANFAPELARWVEHGRIVAGDPRLARS